MLLTSMFILKSLSFTDDTAIFLFITNGLAQVVQPLRRCSRRELFGCTLAFIVSLACGGETGLLGGVAWDLLHLLYKVARPDVPVRRITRVLAAERRMLNSSVSSAGTVVLVRCFVCASDITGKVPFEYLLQQPILYYGMSESTSNASSASAVMNVI